MKKKLKEYIKLQLSTNSAWSLKALVRIYTENQTSDEKAYQHTVHDNGIGFSGCDSEILSSFAEQVIKGRTLSPKQMAIVVRKIPRYWKQVITFIPEDKLNQIQSTIS
jgi:hypothetical protein